MSRSFPCLQSAVNNDLKATLFITSTCLFYQGKRLLYYSIILSLKYMTKPWRTYNTITKQTSDIYIACEIAIDFLEFVEMY